jgi:hypothetical protein
LWHDHTFDLELLMQVPFARTDFGALCAAASANAQRLDSWRVSIVLRRIQQFEFATSNLKQRLRKVVQSAVQEKKKQGG